ncbi:hypothetical protein BJV78DRAFT_1285148 [Lactifluus subvellereus]|nr:hypothetical protein BJV78DRAFT_1285148 [Lactifluus subvellereus]
MTSSSNIPPPVDGLPKVDLLAYLMERDDCPPELRSITRRLTRPDFVYILPSSGYSCKLIWNRVGAGNNTHPIEYVPITSKALVACTTGVPARTFDLSTFTIPSCSPRRCLVK